MGIVGHSSNDTSDFVPHPAGLMPGTIVDVIDLGMLVREYMGEKKPPAPYMAWRVFAGQYKEDGTPLYVTHNKYNALRVSTSVKANARKLVEQGTGRQFTDEEVNAFDYESLIGKSFNFNFVQKTGSKGGVFTNFTTIVPLMPGQVGPGIPDDYVREVDREPSKSKDVRTAVRDPNPTTIQPLSDFEPVFPDTDHDAMPWEE